MKKNSGTESGHILFLLPSFTPSEREDHFPVITDLVKAMAARPGTRVSIICIHYPSGLPYSVYNVMVYPCGALLSKGVGKLKAWWRCVRYFHKIHKEFPVSVIQSFWLNETAMLGNYLSGISGVSHFCYLRGQDVLLKNKYLLIPGMKKTASIALCERQKNIALKNHINVVETIPSGIDPGDAQPRAARDIDIYMNASFIPLKRYGLAVDAIKILVEKGYRPHCVFIGEGPGINKIREQVQKAKLGNFISFAGKISRKKVYELAGRSKIFLHTSVFEGMCGALLEAWSSGCYAVCTPAGIAFEHEKCRIGNNAKILSEHLEYFLLNGNNFSPFILKTAEETAEELWQLWGLKDVVH